MKLRKCKMSHWKMSFELVKQGFFENLRILLFMFFVGIVVCCLEFWLNGSHVLMTPIAVLLLVFLLWAGMPMPEKGIFSCARMRVEGGNCRCGYLIKLWIRFMDGLKLSDKTRLWLLLAIRFFGGALIFVGCCYILNDNKLRFWLVIILAGFVAICLIIDLLYERLHGGIVDGAKSWIAKQWDMFCSLFYFVLPFSIVLATYLFLGVFTFGIPAFLLVGLSRFGVSVLQDETIIFVVFIMGSIVCSHFYGITKWVIRSTPLRGVGNHTYDFARVHLAIDLIHPSNVMFLLYLMYFVLLVITGYLQIEKGGCLFSPEKDAAILKAFLVFIAFANMRVKAKEAKFDVKKLYRRTLKLFVHDL